MIDKSQYDKRVDIWSIGVLAFELMTGKPPFESDSFDETTTKIKKLTIEFPPYLSPEAIDFVLFILKINPSERPSLNQIVEHPWIQKRENYNEI